MVGLDFPHRLETPRLLLQKLKYEDAEEIFYSYASKAEATRFVSWRTHRSVDETIAFIRYAHAAWKARADYTFSIRDAATFRLLGSIGVINQSGTVQFGYILSPTQWNKGYATEACSRILSTLLTMPGIRSIGTFVDLDNTASMRVLAKCGLLKESHLMRFRFPNQENAEKDCAVFTFPLRKSF